MSDKDENVQNDILREPPLRYLVNPPCSVAGKLHYSWDFAQQIHYPHHSQQCGPIFFKTPRKCSVFGICSEGSGKQTFYLIDEAECVGKGANCVVSMAHHYFQHHSHGETDVVIHFGNCCGQNKNNVVLWYSMWRVFQGLHQSVELSMMIAGHTKFEPDWNFGLWKRSNDSCTVNDGISSYKFDKSYANEVGEAFRSQVHVNIVRLSYGVASSYVVTDAIHKGFKTAEVPWQTEQKRRTKVQWAVFDTLIWQGLASVIIPGFTINRTCALCNFLLKKQVSIPQQTRKWITTCIGLVCIPFIIKPIDKSVDFFLERTFRKYYDYQGHIMKTIVHHTRDD